MTKVIQIDGGIGRVLCAEPAIRRLAEAGNQIEVITSWPDVFTNHPNIKSIWPMHSPNIWQEVIKGNAFLTPEPYNDYFYYNKNHHLTQSFDYLINEMDPNGIPLTKPSIFLSEEEKFVAKTELTAMIRDHKTAAFTIVIQPFGSSATTSTVNMSLNMPREERVIDSEKFRAARQNELLESFDGTNRSLSMADACDILNSLNNDFLILNFSHIKIQHPHVYNMDTSLRNWFGLISLADYFIGVDSVGQHIAASFNIPGTVFFGGTAAENLAYPDIHDIIQKDGYPKEYIPYRQNFPHSVNDKAMAFDRETIASVCEKVNKRFF